jgi:hypothetical protein
MEPAKIAMSMSAFEKAFENIEVAVGSMTGAMDVATASMVPTDEVEEMMKQIASVSAVLLRLPLMHTVSLRC